MKTLLRTFALVLIVVISASNFSFAADFGKGPQKDKSYAQKRKLSHESSFYSKEAKQSKYRKCPKFRKAK